MDQKKNIVPYDLTTTTECGVHCDITTSKISKESVQCSYQNTLTQMTNNRVHDDGKLYM